MEKRYEILVRGRVQGVGFRWFACQLANKYHLTGYVENLPDGLTVKMEAQGEEIRLEKFITEIEAGNRWIRVDTLTRKEQDMVPHESGFDYRGW